MTTKYRWRFARTLVLAAVVGFVPLALLVGLAPLTAFATPPPASGDVDHGLYSRLLKAHVRDGHVNYAALCHDDRFDRYLQMLSAADPESIVDDDARLAFWINAYNALTLKLICDNYPVDSINDLHFGGRIVGHVLRKTAWTKKFFEINGEEMHLNNIEHDIIRKQFNEPRIHFALVCAAVSCPPLRNEAFVGERLDEQLTDQATTFLGNEANNRFDMAERVAYLSPILNWYGSDFGKNKAAVLLAIARFLPQETAAAITADPDAWKVSYLDYDWDLNE